MNPSATSTVDQHTAASTPHSPRQGATGCLSASAFTVDGRERRVASGSAWENVRNPVAVAIEFRNVTVTYGSEVALDDISLEMPANQIFGIIGAANSGKTTLLKCINRTIELVDGAHMSGELRVDGHDVKRIKNVFELRRRVGMVFPLPVGLPMSIYDNVAYAPRMSGLRDRAELDALVEKCLRQAALWDEVKDRMQMLGTKLSGGQQQRLTLARALSHKPDILCLDEFSIAIDPVTTMKIEDVLWELKNEMTIVLVTNLVQQAHRLADRTAFFNNSKLIEVGDTKTIFTSPANPLTMDYVTGNIG
jgi:phosphate transport system ATP-binding protein